MRTRIAWCLGISLALFCGTLVIQNLRLARQIASLRIEMEQKNSPVVASEESKTSKMDSDELDRLRKNNSELIRLRNKFGLLQNELTDLHQQRAEILREKTTAQNQSLGIEPALEEKIRYKMQAEAIAGLNEQLVSRQLKLEETKSALIEMSKALNIPDGESKTVSFADLTPNQIQQVRSYFDIQREVENNHRVVEALTRKLESERAEFGVAK